MRLNIDRYLLKKQIKANGYKTYEDFCAHVGCDKKTLFRAFDESQMTEELVIKIDTKGEIDPITYVTDFQAERGFNYAENGTGND